MTTEQELQRTVYWKDGRVWMINQPKLPLKYEVIAFDTYQEVADAIRTMVVRGAPAIGAAAGFGMAIAAQKSETPTVEGLRKDLIAAGEVLAKSRPTAVNLFWAIKRMNTLALMDFDSVDAMKAAMLAEAQKIADEDVEINKRMGAYGAELVPENATIIHHCNTGSLATVNWGTALGVIRSAHYAGKGINVLVDETRPRLQGARLTSWELKQENIPHKVIADSASGHYMRTQGVDLCVVGADRIAANGDAANKIGTYNLAVVARENGVPFYVAAPISTIDMDTPTGDSIEIEERGPVEVTHVRESQITPDDVEVGNPAFDVTPAKYITAIITEFGVIRPPFDHNIRKLMAEHGS